MGVLAQTVDRSKTESSGWLHSRNWDLTFITLNVVLVTVPYLSYLALTNMDMLLGPIAGSFGSSVDDISRNIVNFTIALLIGGPHMYATFTRTALDKDYVQKHPRVIWTSLAIPVVVVSLALFNLQLLLTVFFFWASVHVLHQIIFITEMYNHKGKRGLSPLSRGIDYALILTALYPLAAWKIYNNAFTIGQNNLSATVRLVFDTIGIPWGNWFVWMAGGAFGLSLLAWVVKTLFEAQRGEMSMPKTAFLGLTVLAAFWVPALGNLDTAFQGMNLWHSLQYLALTWMLNNLRLERGEMEKKPFLKRISEDGSARKFYLFNVGVTAADVVLAVGIFFLLRFVGGYDFDPAFDRAYYIAVLSFLWIHYYHDHFLFTEPEVIGS